MPNYCYVHYTFPFNIMRKSLFALSFSKNIANYNRMKFNINSCERMQESYARKKKITR